MIIIEKPLAEKDYIFSQTLKKILFEESKGSLLVLDIETTGLSSYASIYMLGFICVDENPRLIQWFAENPEDEYQMLYQLIRFIDCFDKILTYNGNSFDIPFIKKRMSFYKIRFTQKHHDFHDLFQDIRPYKKILSLDNLKQKSLELRFNINRKDSYSGKELISIYKEYLKNSSEDLMQLLFLHNMEDILGLLELSQFYAYIKIIDLIKNNKLAFQSITAKAYNNNLEIQIIINNPLFTLITLPEALAINTSHFGISINSKGLIISAPLIAETLYYFFEDYQNYYYLPQEDMAVHKSIGKFVQKNFRKNAQPKTAYTKKRGIFIPLGKPSELFSSSKLFKKAYSLSEYFLEYSPAQLNDQDFISEYSSNLLSNLDISNLLVEK